MSYDRFNADNAAMLLIDHQVGTIEWMHPAEAYERRVKQKTPRFFMLSNEATRRVGIWLITLQD